MAMVEDVTDNVVLQTLLRDAGFTAAVDVALIDEEMAVELCASRPDLRDELLGVAAGSHLAINGWARAVTVFGGCGVGGRSEGTVKLQNVPASSASGAPPGAGGPGKGEQRASGSLRAVTRRVLKGSVKSSPPAPPCFSRLGIEKHKIKLAASRTHGVLLKYFPSCGRLRALGYSDAAAGDSGDAAAGEIGAAAAGDGALEEHACIVRADQIAVKQNGYALKHACPDGRGTRRAEDPMAEQFRPDCEEGVPILRKNGPRIFLHASTPPVQTASPTPPGDSLGVLGAVLYWDGGQRRRNKAPRRDQVPLGIGLKLIFSPPRNPRGLVKNPYPSNKNKPPTPPPFPALFSTKPISQPTPCCCADGRKRNRTSTGSRQ